MKNSVLVSILAIASISAAQFDSEQCGPNAGNQKCTQNKCCSQYGWCGTSNAYCQASRGCQVGFGRCTGILSTSTSSPSSSAVRSSAAVASPSASAALVSKTGRCGSAFGGQTCKGSTFGDCCSSYNWCGKTTDHCKASLGCQPGFGTCTGVQSSSISVSVSRSSSQQPSSSSVSNTSSRSSSTSSSLSSSSSSTRTSGSSSSSSIATSSSSSSAISSSSASSSSSVPSSSSAVPSSSSAIPSSSSAIPSSSSSSLMSSGITTSASPSTSLISSTNTITASPSASGSVTGTTHVLRAARNPSVDRTASANLVPKNAVSFYFAEDGSSYTTSVQTNLDSGALGVLLENIASISSVTCSGSSINLQFSDEASFNAARSWPAGTILFTLSDGCNTATERGVYRLGAATATTLVPKLRARVTLLPQNNNVWQLPLEALLIQMEAVVANYDEFKRQAAEAAAADVTVIPTPPATSTSAQITSTVSSVAVSSSTSAQPSASASSLPACGGYAPGGRFDIAGTTYQISCTLAGTWRAIWIDITYQSTFADCMAFCNTNKQCVVATWNVQQVQNGKYMCQRWSMLPYKYDNAVDSPMAVKVVPVSSSSSAPTATPTA